MFQDAQSILSQGGTPVSTAMLDQANHSVHGKECCGCGNVLHTGQFRRDSSYKEGVRDLCLSCESSPRLNTIEHTERLRERNYNSHAVRAQRWENQADYEDERPRWGIARHSSFVIRELRTLCPSLYFMDGRIAGDVSIFRTFGQPQPDLGGNSFQYLFYLPTGWMPEFSIYEFDERDIPIKERIRGWRTVILRLIKTGLLTENQADNNFGIASGLGSVVYRRSLYQWRNR